MGAQSDDKYWFGLLNPQYMWVWLALFVLTVVEVIVPEPYIIPFTLESLGLPTGFLAGLEDFHFPRVFVVVSLILMALVKTILVAWYYMHLISERPAMILIAAAPFIFSIFLTIGLFPWQGG